MDTVRVLKADDHRLFERLWVTAWTGWSTSRLWERPKVATKLHSWPKGLSLPIVPMAPANAYGEPVAATFQVTSPSLHAPFSS